MFMVVVEFVLVIGDISQTTIWRSRIVSLISSMVMIGQYPHNWSIPSLVASTWYDINSQAFFGRRMPPDIYVLGGGAAKYLMRDRRTRRPNADVHEWSSLKKRLCHYCTDMLGLCWAIIRAMGNPHQDRGWVFGPTAEVRTILPQLCAPWSASVHLVGRPLWQWLSSGSAMLLKLTVLDPNLPTILCGLGNAVKTKNLYGKLRHTCCCSCWFVHVLTAVQANSRLGAPKLLLSSRHLHYTQMDYLGIGWACGFSTKIEDRFGCLKMLVVRCC